MKAVQEKHCGSCALFKYEDAHGNGWCELMQDTTSTELWCINWVEEECLKDGCGNCNHFDRKDTEESGWCYRNCCAMSCDEYCDMWELMDWGDEIL